MVSVTHLLYGKRKILLLLLACAITGALSTTLSVNAAPQALTFPIVGSSSYTNDYDAPRSNGKHYATDIFAKKGQKIVSATDGTIQYVTYPEPYWGYAVIVKGNDNYCYWYLHINNDAPGTDNGSAKGPNVFGPDIKAGNPIKKGQHLGYVGDSGNAENTPPHLHFSMHKLPSPSTSCDTARENDIPPVNPYTYLKSATYISKPVNYPQLANELLPYGIDGIATSVAIGNVDSAADQEVITGAGAGGAPSVRAFKNNRTLVKQITAYNSTFRGGVHVAAGDVDGDGVDEIITGAGTRGGPHVKIFKTSGALVKEFYAYDIANRDGVIVASGDLNGDGKAEIVTAPAVGREPRVKVFAASGQLMEEFAVYDVGFSGGVDVAIGDVLNNDGKNEIITAAGKSGGPHIVVYDMKGVKLKEFYAYDKAFRGGTRVSVGNVVSSNPGDEIVTSPMTTGGPHIRAFNGSGTALYNKYFIEEWWRDGQYDVAAGDSMIRASVGVNRRTSVKYTLN